MKAYSELSREELMELREQLLAAYEEKKALGLNLDMSRGKPSPTQLGVSVGLMDVINSDSDMMGALMEFQRSRDLWLR